MKLDLKIDEIKDPVVLENSRKIDQEFKDNFFLKGKWQKIELTFTGAVANYAFPHSLSFVPKDILQTKLSGAGGVEWHYEDFTKTHIYLTTTGACTVRALVGSF
jgi:hypothetical protein